MHTVKIRPLPISEAYNIRKYKKPAYKAYEKELLLILLPRKVDTYPKMKISFVFGFKNPASDVDNPIKCFMDVLQKKYDFDDRMVFEINAKKVITKETFIQFKIEPYEEG